MDDPQYRALQPAIVEVRPVCANSVARLDPVPERRFSSAAAFAASLSGWKDHATAAPVQMRMTPMPRGEPSIRQRLVPRLSEAAAGGSASASSVAEGAVAASGGRQPCRTISRAVFMVVYEVRMFNKPRLCAARSMPAG